VHFKRKVLNTVSTKDKAEIGEELKALFPVEHTDMTPLAAYENLRTFSRRWGGQEVPEPFPIGQRTQCGLFHLSKVSRKCTPNDLLDQLGGTSQSLLQAHFAYAWNDAFSRLGGLSLGLCCQGENGRDVCKTTTVFWGVENMVKWRNKRFFNEKNSFFPEPLCDSGVYFLYHISYLSTPFW